MSKFNVGDKVRYIGTEHDIDSQWYPSIGTIGTVVQDVDEIDCYIQWPKGSTSKEDCWYCNKKDIELVENVDMTNEEIWEMLRPKMRKNGLEIAGYLQDYTGEVGCYDEDDVHNAIALAYRSGYLRAIKGRPFMINKKKVKEVKEEKKKGGHWEPVDPNNLPKEGTKIRYAREYTEYKEIPLIALGDIGTFAFGKANLLPGIKFDDGRFWDWLCFNGVEDCLDMWVEDDE